MSKRSERHDRPQRRPATPAPPGSRASSRRAASTACSGCRAATSSRSGTMSARLGIRIVDVRDEGAAVHMAHAHAELTGQLGVAMVTAGPGVTNTVTAIANASLARDPGAADRRLHLAAAGQHGPAAGHPARRHPAAGDPPRSRTLRVADQVIRELDEAVARAMGDLGEPGPVYLEIPTDVLRTTCRRSSCSTTGCGRSRRAMLPPDPAAVAAAVEAIWSARRPLVDHRPRRARRRRRSSCACSTPRARSISTPRRAAAWCPPSIRRSSAPCARRR